MKNKTTYKNIRGGIKVAYIYIYNYKVAKDLLRNGFTIKDIKPNPQNRDRTMFLFEDTPLLREYIKQQWDIVI